MGHSTGGQLETLEERADRLALIRNLKEGARYSPEMRGRKESRDSTCQNQPEGPFGAVILW
jgi:hypothetical protein